MILHRPRFMDDGFAWMADTGGSGYGSTLKHATFLPVGLFIRALKCLARFVHRSDHWRGMMALVRHPLASVTILSGVHRTLCPRTGQVPAKILYGVD